MYHDFDELVFFPMCTKKLTPNEHINVYSNATKKVTIYLVIHFYPFYMTFIYDLTHKKGQN